MLKEDAKARLEFLMQQADQARAQYNAILGRIEEVKLTIEMFEKKEQANITNLDDVAA